MPIEKEEEKGTTMYYVRKESLHRKRAACKHALAP
jgi:hypothetical protein